MLAAGEDARAARPARLLAVAAGILRSDPGATLRQIGERLEAIRERTLHSGTTW